MLGLSAPRQVSCFTAMVTAWSLVNVKKSQQLLFPHPRNFQGVTIFYKKQGDKSLAISREDGVIREEGAVALSRTKIIHFFQDLNKKWAIVVGVLCSVYVTDILFILLC